MKKFLKQIKARLLQQRSEQTLRTRAAAMFYLPRFVQIESLGVADLPRSALVLSPHPDDETLGCGGTLALLTSQGAHVQVICATQGERAALHEGIAEGVRAQELRRACQTLGVSDVVILAGRDGALRSDGALVQTLSEALKKMRPAACFIPWPGDNHDDHVALFDHALQALEQSGVLPEIWMYEVWSPLLANRAVNIDAVIETKLAALQAYVSQNETLGLVERFRALARYRSFLCRDSKYAEAFLVGDLAFVKKISRDAFRVGSRLSS